MNLNVEIVREQDGTLTVEVTTTGLDRAHVHAWGLRATHGPLAERLARVGASEFDFLKACLEGGPEPCAQLRWAHFGPPPADALRA